MDATLCKQLNGDEPVDPTSTFPKDAPAVYGAWWSSELREGQTVRIVWIAEDVGKAAKPNFKISESTVPITREQKREPGTFKFHVQIGKLPVTWVGRMSLTAPGGKTWPVGKYRVEILVDDQPIKTLPFTVQ